MNLSELKKSRSLDFSNITKALTKSTETGYKNDDEDIFKVTRDKAGNGSAVIRFLAPAAGDELPWVQIYSHGFQGPTGRWYINNCLSTLGVDDPVNIANRELWNGSEKDKEVARKQKRKLSYVSNVYVVSDPGNRENEGKVFKFKFGKKIFEKIMEKVQPTFVDEKPINVFDLWEGANFKLRMRQYEGFPNYDQSAFADPSPVAATDEDILAIVNSQFKLSELLDPKNFKTYAELDAQFKSVMTAGPARGVKESEAPTVEARAPKSVEPKSVKATGSADEEESLEDYFKSIAN